MKTFQDFISKETLTEEYGSKGQPMSKEEAKTAHSMLKSMGWEHKETVEDSHGKKHTFVNKKTGEKHEFYSH